MEEFLHNIKDHLHRIFLTFLTLISQILCVVFFFPVARPRETVCGLVGRYIIEDCTWRGALAESIAPKLEKCFHKSSKCVEIYFQEERCRKIFYPKQ